MKQLLILSLVVMTFSFSCRKENVTLDTGTITGPDSRECVCCGGWFVNINDSLWRFTEQPANSDVDLTNTTFPIVVELKWEKDADACLSDEIIVSYIRKK